MSQVGGHRREKEQFVALALLGEVWCPSLYDSYLWKRRNNEKAMSEVVSAR